MRRSPRTPPYSAEMGRVPSGRGVGRRATDPVDILRPAPQLQAEPHKVWRRISTSVLFRVTCRRHTAMAMAIARPEAHVAIRAGPLQRLHRRHFLDQSKVFLVVCAQPYHLRRSFLEDAIRVPGL